MSTTSQDLLGDLTEPVRGNRNEGDLFWRLIGTHPTFDPPHSDRLTRSASTARHNLGATVSEKRLTPPVSIITRDRTYPMPFTACVRWPEK